MSKKGIIWMSVLLVVAIGGLYVYKEYTRRNKDLTDVKPDLQVKADQLINEYESDDSVANKKYLGKILEVTGKVRELKKDDDGYYMVILGDTSELSSVRCLIDTIHQEDAARLRLHTSTTVRGACTGFNKDEMGLGSDVILNRCVIISKKE
jgi:hypothetical protein